MATQQSAASLTSQTQLISWELAAFDIPQTILEDPPPHTKLGQQVRRLEQLGLYKMAGAVKVCGRLGEKWGYECGLAVLAKIIRSHRRFCCRWCDQYVAARLFEEHNGYVERLHPRGTLHRIDIRTGDHSLSSDGTRDFEDAVVEAVRLWLKGSKGWGFEFLTHYEDGCLIAKAIIYLPSGVSLPPNGPAISFGTCKLGRASFVTAYKAMLADILRPCLTGGHSVLRADLMAAFSGGKHFRSLGIFYGLISDQREKKRTDENQAKLHLSAGSGATLQRSETPSAQLPGSATSSNVQPHSQEAAGELHDAAEENLHLSVVASVSGATFLPSQHWTNSFGSQCPRCGPSCQRISVSVEPLSELQDIPNMENRFRWAAMRLSLQRRSLF